MQRLKDRPALRDKHTYGPIEKANIFMAQFVDLGADVSSSIPDYTFKVNACLWAAAAANDSLVCMHGLEK
jgi:hypothetical protein